jgi:anti-anti-sigma factor
MAVDLKTICLPFLNAGISNIIVNMQAVATIDTSISQTIALIHQQFYDNNVSFVICSISAGVKEVLKKEELDDVLNITPSESEAWDIVQMEEIERELLEGEDFLF